MFHPEFENKYLRNAKVIQPLGIRIKEHLEGCHLPIDQVSDADISDIPPWELVTPNVNMALHSSTKRETQDLEYRQRFMEINDNYETEKFVPVYTDGSKSDNYVSSSAVFPVDIFKANLLVHTSIFTAEAVALKLAVQYIQRDAIPKSVIYSDSLSCLQALANKNFENPIIREIVHIITYLHEVGSQIVFCWIPGHVGIKGNEKADKIAKDIIDHKIYGIKTPYTDFRLQISKYVDSLFQAKWDACGRNFSKYVDSLFQAKWDACGRNKLHEIKENFLSSVKLYSAYRKDDVTLTRLRIGHTRLTHRHYLANEDAPECIPCDRPLTVKHILIECIDTAEIRKQYFNCPDLKTLFNSVAGDTILAFLSEVNLMNKI